MKVLIVGKNSFIGTSYKKKYGLFHQIDEACLESNKLADLDFSPYDVLIHLAAIVHVHSGQSREAYFEVNSDLAYNVALKAKKDGVKQFVLFSSVKVFGEYNTLETPWSESSECKPFTFYGQSKLHAEDLINKLDDANFVITVVRPCLVYGPGVKANMLNLIKLVDKVPWLPFGAINNARSFVYISNLLDLLNLLIESQSRGVFIASDAKALSTTGLSQLIADALGKKRYFYKLPGPLKSAISKIIPNFYQAIWSSFLVDPRSGYDRIGFKPGYSTKEGVEAMVNWYKNIK